MFSFSIVDHNRNKIQTKERLSYRYINELLHTHTLVITGDIIKYTEYTINTEYTNNTKTSNFFALQRITKEKSIIFALNN